MRSSKSNSTGNSLTVYSALSLFIFAYSVTEYTIFYANLREQIPGPYRPGICVHINFLPAACTAPVVLALV